MQNNNSPENNGDYNFSKAGVKDVALFSSIYSEFITWCKKNSPTGTFSTYCDGEPVFFYNGAEISYRKFLNSNN